MVCKQFLKHMRANERVQIRWSVQSINIFFTYLKYFMNYTSSFWLIFAVNGTHKFKRLKYTAYIRKYHKIVMIPNMAFIEWSIRHMLPNIW